MELSLAYPPFSHTKDRCLLADGFTNALLHDGWVAGGNTVYYATQNIRNYKEIKEMRMNKNCCGLDQFLRTGIGLGLIYIGFVDTTLIGDTIIATFVGIFGVVNVLSGLSGFCPVYTMAGICTRTTKDEATGHPLKK